MKAVVYSGYRVTPELTEVAAPGCPAGGVVIDVGATGVCRSDWHAWQGHDPVPLPHIPGHELAGTVAQAGPGVTRWRPGDRVTVPFVCGCGTCEYCLAGQAQVCPRHVQVGLLLGPDAAAPLPMDLVIARELEIYGSHGMAARDYPAMLARIADQTLQPGRLIGPVIGLAGAGAALAAMGQPPAAAGMTVIDLTQ
jgi:alcohol dehydrogenase